MVMCQNVCIRHEWLTMSKQRLLYRICICIACQHIQVSVKPSHLTISCYFKQGYIYYIPLSGHVNHQITIVCREPIVSLIIIHISLTAAAIGTIGKNDLDLYLSSSLPLADNHNLSSLYHALSSHWLAVDILMNYPDLDGFSSVCVGSDV